MHIKFSNVDVDRQLRIGVLMRFIAENTGSTLALEPESTEICGKLSDTNGYTEVMFSFTCWLCIDCMHGCV